MRRAGAGRRPAAVGRRRPRPAITRRNRPVDCRPGRWRAGPGNRPTGGHRGLDKTEAGAPSVRLETTGIRTQVAGLAAAALRPGSFTEVEVRGGMASLNHLIGAPVDPASAELFCLDLYRATDLDRMAALAAPTRVEAGREDFIRRF